MAYKEPFEQLTGTLTVYIAPHTSPLSVPDVDDTPTSPWVELGDTDGEQSIQHAGALTYFRDNANQGPRKAVRPEEDVIITFTLVGLTLENYARMLDDVDDVEETSAGAATIGTKKLPLERGFSPTEYGILLKGEAISPYGVWPGMYVVTRGVFDGEPTPTFAKDGRPGLEVEFHAIVDENQDAGEELGWLIVQHEEATGEQG